MKLMILEDNVELIIKTKYLKSSAAHHNFKVNVI